MLKYLLHLISLVLLASCNQTPDDTITHFNGIKMTVPYHVAVGSSLSHQEKIKAQNIIDKTFKDIDRIYNKWNPHSEISAINRAKANEELPLSPALHQFFIQVDTLVEETGGRFDPTVETAQQLWKNAFEKGKCPSQNEIDRALSTIGWHHIHLTANGIWKDNHKTTLDLGGIAKGYAIDLIVQRLTEAGFQNLYVEWGGDIAVKGRHPDNRPWRILVTKWGVPGDTQTVVELTDMAIASSGDYLQNWSVDQEAYTHIFNPRTGHPLKITSQSVCSVTVTASTCLLADTIATTAMLFESIKDSENWLESMRTHYPEMQFWVYTR